MNCSHTLFISSKQRMKYSLQLSLCWALLCLSIYIDSNDCFKETGQPGVQGQGIGAMQGGGHGQQHVCTNSWKWWRLSSLAPYAGGKPLSNGWD
jgi:hypothetical protein